MKRTPSRRCNTSTDRRWSSNNSRSVLVSISLIPLSLSVSISIGKTEKRRRGPAHGVAVVVRRPGGLATGVVAIPLEVVREAGGQRGRGGGYLAVCAGAGGGVGRVVAGGAGAAAAAGVGFAGHLCPWFTILFLYIVLCCIEQLSASIMRMLVQRFGSLKAVLGGRSFHGLRGCGV